MDCSEYRMQHAKYSKLPLSREDSESPGYDAWVEHFHSCDKCSDWDLSQRVIKRGHDPDSFPCVHIADQVTQTCDNHQDPHDCPDILITYSPKFDEYCIPIRDGGSSGANIRYCPWCGVKLPESKRDQWFQELESKGFDDPWVQDIPPEYLTDEWYKKKT